MNKENLIEDIAWLVAYYVVNELPIPQDLSEANSPEVSGNELESAKAKNIFESAKDISAEQAFRWIAEIYSVSFLNK